MDIFIQQIINGLVLGSMYALIALGYTMVYGVLNLINFAHGDVLMIGAMAGLSILKLVQHVAPDLPGIVKLIIAIIGAIPVCVIVSMIIERVAYRPLRNAPRLAPLITAIGVSILLQTLAMMIWGRSPLPFPQIMPSDPVHIAGALISPTQIMLLLLALAAMIGLVLIVEKTKMGRAMRATAENPRIAGLMGVDSNRVIVVTFVIGAALAAIAAPSAAPLETPTNPGSATAQASVITLFTRLTNRQWTIHSGNAKAPPSEPSSLGSNETICAVHHPSPENRPKLLNEPSALLCLASRRSDRAT